MPDLLLTFDIGTTALKVGLFDVSGRVLAISTQEYDLIAPRSGWAELPVERYWEACVAGTRDCLLERSGANVRAIGFSSQGQTFVPMDSEFRPLRNAIVWLDVRAAEQAERIKAYFAGREREAAIGVIPIASGPKILWLRENEPEVFARAACYMMPPDYLTWRLTGQRVGDPCDLGSTAMMDRHNRRWWPPMLDFIGIREEQLPRIGVAGEPVGELLPEAARELGISPEAICVVGANDQTAGMIGTANVRPGIISATIGTALAIMATTDGYVEDPTGCVMTGYHAVPGKGMVLSFTQTGAMALTWWRDAVEGPGRTGEDACPTPPSGSAGVSPATDGRPTGRPYNDLIEEAMQAPPGCDGLLMLPHLTGTACPDYNADARGAFVGLSLSHRRAHMIRAILEAVAYCLREHVERIRPFAWRRVSRPAGTGEDACPTQDDSFIRALGGGAKSDFWLQMMADVTGLPMERAACEHAASLGAAAMAAVGAGYFGSIEQAADAYYKAERRFEPEAALFPAYDEAYQRFQALYQTLYGR